MADSATLRRVAGPCGAVAVALLAGACAASASGLLVAVAALALLAVLAVLADLGAANSCAIGLGAADSRAAGLGATRRGADGFGPNGRGAAGLRTAYPDALRSRPAHPGEAGLDADGLDADGLDAGHIGAGGIVGGARAWASGIAWSSSPPARGRGFPVLVLGVAFAVAAALWVAGVARVAPVGGGRSCLGAGPADRLELPLALAAQFAAAVSVLWAANAARGGASWWRYVRHSPRLGAALAVVLHVIALGATAAVLTAEASCHAAQARFIDAVAVGAVAAGIGAVAVVLAVRLAGMVAASPASAADANGVELALVAADVRSVAQLRVVQVAHDELLVTARVGLPAGEDVAVALGRARRHIQDFVPAARHVYLQPESPPP